MSVVRARLQIHDLGDGGLLLIHEIDQPSYMVLWDFELPEIIYCGVVASGPLQSGLVAGSTLMDMASSSRPTVLSSGLEATTETVFEVGAQRTVSARITGGHC